MPSLLNLEYEILVGLNDKSNWNTEPLFGTPRLIEKIWHMYLFLNVDMILWLNRRKLIETD